MYRNIFKIHQLLSKICLQILFKPITVNLYFSKKCLGKNLPLLDTIPLYERYNFLLLIKLIIPIYIHNLHIHLIVCKKKANSLLYSGFENKFYIQIFYNFVQTVYVKLSSFLLQSGS